MSGTLYLCATPIGNLEDITLRVLRTLQEVDVIAAEDTRNTIKLLNHFEIKTPMTSYHEYNKVDKAAYLVEQLANGKNVALVTDAGYSCHFGSRRRTGQTGLCCGNSRHLSPRSLCVRYCTHSVRFIDQTFCI